MYRKTSTKPKIHSKLDQNFVSFEQGLPHNSYAKQLQAFPNQYRNTGPRCGLCGNPTNLKKTDCCDQWICDDQDQYEMFSYANNSCYRNHSRYTLCGFHHAEDHPGDWKTCDQCRTDFEPEMIAWYGTNEYNFEKMPNPPDFEPTRCAKCKKIINLGEDAFTFIAMKHYCTKCKSINI